MDKWDARGLQAAQLYSTWSKDPSTKCGAAIMRPDKSIVSGGFNGFPKGTSDADEFYADRELKYARVVHAEVNAVVQAGEKLHGYTMFTWPPNYGPSCDRCSAVIIQAGITRVVHVYEVGADFAERWRLPIERGLQMYEEAGVEIVHITPEEYRYYVRENS